MNSSSLVHWPAPPGEAPSPDFTLDIDGTPVFVHPARVRADILRNDGLWTHQRDPAGERAAFAIFDIRAPVTVTVRPARPFRAAAVLPERAGIVPEIADGTIRFRLEKPHHVTVALDDSDTTPLHLFVGAPETDIPRPDDPDVLYFGPGVHDVTELRLRDGQTVYLAGGALVRAVLKPDEQPTYSEKWKVNFYHGAVLNVQGVCGVRIRGRGILDGSAVPHPGRNLVRINDCHDVRLEGIVLRDAPNWNVTLRKSTDVVVTDLRIVSGRLNSDGINSVNSQRVQVTGCFVRNHDDSIVVKTTEPAPPAEAIDVRDCVIWNDWGYALGVTYETRAPVRSVSFRGCDILFSQHWCLGVHVSDGATVEGIRFADIGVGRLVRPAVPGSARAALTAAPKLLRLAIVRDVWGKDSERGQIRDVLVDGVTVHGAALPSSEILGADADHTVSGVTLRAIRRAGQQPATDATALGLRCNEHVRDIRVLAR